MNRGRDVCVPHPFINPVVSKYVNIIAAQPYKEISKSSCCCQLSVAMRAVT